MKNKLGLLVAPLALGLVLTGCNVGMAPQGSDDAPKRDYEKMSLEKKIDFIRRSPMPQADKEKYVREAQKEAGVPEDLSVLQGGSSPAGVPQQPAGQ